MCVCVCVQSGDTCSSCLLWANTRQESGLRVKVFFSLRYCPFQDRTGEHFEVSQVKVKVITFSLGLKIITPLMMYVHTDTEGFKERLLIHFGKFSFVKNPGKILFIPLGRFVFMKSLLASYYISICVSSVLLIPHSSLSRFSRGFQWRHFQLILHNCSSAGRIPVWPSIWSRTRLSLCL